MQDQIKKDFEELRSLNNRGLELISDAREILDKGVTEEMKKKIESEKIDDRAFNHGFNLK
jgi:plasmid rolling circle replication initiator protein Rep